MINLLPTQYKEEIKQENNWKMFLVLGLVALFSLLSLFLILLFVKIHISGQVKVQETLLDSEEELFERSGAQELEKETKLINDELSQLHSFYQEQFRPSDFLQQLSETLPEDSYFTRLDFKHLSSEEEIEISLNGFTPNREALRQLKNNLETGTNIYELTFPEINWINPDNFSITLKIKT